MQIMQITQSDFAPGRTRVGKGNSIERSQSDHLWVLRLWQAKAVGYDVKYASELRFCFPVDILEAVDHALLWE